MTAEGSSDEAASSDVADWAIATPTRYRDWMGTPAIIVVVAAAVAIPTPLRLIEGPRFVAATIAILMAVGAVIIAGLGLEAYRRQSFRDTGRLVVGTRVVAGVFSAVFLIAGVTVPGVFLLVFGSGWTLVATSTSRYAYLRDPRPVWRGVAAGLLTLAGYAATLLIIGLTTDAISERLSAAWVAHGLLVVPVALIVAVVLLRRAHRDGASRL